MIHAVLKKSLTLACKKGTSAEPTKEILPKPEAPARFNINPKLVNSNATKEADNLYQFLGGTKMLTLTEVGSIPDVDNLLKDGAAWSWFMPWYGDYTRSSTHNALELWKKMFASDYVITLDEMPSLKN